MNFVKKQTASTWITLIVLILALVSVIIYGVNVSSTGYFKSITSSTVVVSSVFELIILVAILVLAQFKLKGYLGQVENLIVGALKVVAAFLPILALLAFVNVRVDGLGYVLGSSEEIKDTIQTAENMSSCYTAIAGFVFYFITAIVAIVGAFFRPYGKAGETAKNAA
ncbi:MAG: hypothetical protein LUE27_08905 [Clostridia bacterium]|nr:hypothetical protein [Clostridia bacterium]